jgi:hypothetical protein
MRRREAYRVRAAHRMADDERALDRERVEHRDGVGDELVRCVALGWLAALAMTARVRRDQAQTARDRVGEEVPVAAVVADAVEQQGRRWIAGPLPSAQLDRSTLEYMRRWRGRHGSRSILAA